ncbi:hypothetical protein LCGC14_2738850 [marine sediment metagenome]|uniref:Uncharacterized protein n=1 Tax=marine sediment metagenome TaxID=412755 RepID=A0A0F8Z532_9ZZZZ
MKKTTMIATILLPLLVVSFLEGCAVAMIGTTLLTPSLTKATVVQTVLTGNQNIQTLPKTACDDSTEYNQVAVLDSFPDAYKELGYIIVSSSGGTLRKVSYENQIKRARMEACRISADAIIPTATSTMDVSGMTIYNIDTKTITVIVIRYAGEI